MKRLQRWLRWLLGALFRAMRAAPLPGVVLTTYREGAQGMGSLNISVVHPVQRTDGTAFDPLTELRGWRAYTRLQGAESWTPVGDLQLPSVTTRVVGNVPPGVYEAQVTWEDIYGQASAPAIDSTDVPVPAPPVPGGVSLTFQA